MIWSLAFSALSRRPIRTFLTALGIAVAVGSMVIFLSLGEGLRKAFASQIGSIGPDLQVSFGDFDASASFTMLPELPAYYLTELRQKSSEFGIKRATPLLSHFRAGLSPSNSFVFQGLPPEENLADLFSGFKLNEGRSLSIEDETSEVALIGAQVAKRSQLTLGRQLRLNGDYSFEIVGIVSSSEGIVDNSIIVPLKSLQAALGITDKLSFITLDLDEPSRAAETAKKLKAAYPDLGFQTRADVLGVLEQGVKVTDVVRLGISTIALIVGAIAVANTMMMSVFERTREFGVVRAIGARPRFLFGLVLGEALLLSFVGAVAGVILGRLGMIAVNAISINLIGLEVAALTLRLVIFAVAVAFLMGLVSGLIPAFRAARISIATAMARE